MACSIDLVTRFREARESRMELGGLSKGVDQGGRVRDNHVACTPRRTCRANAPHTGSSNPLARSERSSRSRSTPPRRSGGTVGLNSVAYTYGERLSAQCRPTETVLPRPDERGRHPGSAGEHAWIMHSAQRRPTDIDGRVDVGECWLSGGAQAGNSTHLI